MGKVLDKKVKIVFQFPLPPEEKRPPKGEVIPYPEAVVAAKCPLPGYHPPQPKHLRLDISECFFLDYLVFETYGEYRLEFERSYSELCQGAKKLFGKSRGGWTTIHRGFTKPRVARALEKFKKLGLLTAESVDVAGKNLAH